MWAAYNRRKTRTIHILLFLLIMETAKRARWLEVGLQ